MQVTLVFHNAPNEVQQVRNLEIVPETDTLRLELDKSSYANCAYDWSDVKELRIEP